MSDAADETAAIDRSLPWRTFAAAILGGAAGWGLGHAIVRILAGLATPSYAKYIRAARLDESVARMPWWFGAGGESFGALWLSWGLVAAAALAFPFLFNRRWCSRRIFSLAGIGKLLLTFALLGVVDLLVAALTNAPGAVPAGADLGLGAFAYGAPANWLAKVALAGLGTAALFVVAGERTLGGSLDRWRNPELSPGGVFAGAFVGFLIGVALALVAVWLAGVLTMLVQALFGFLGESPEPSALGWTRVHLGLTTALALLLAACCALPVAMGPSAAPRGRRVVALVLAALPIAAIFGLGTWFKGYCLEHGGMRHATLAAAASLEPAPAPRLLALPGEGGAHVVAYPMIAEAIGVTTDEKVGATPGNVQRARAWLEQRGGRWTVHSIKAHSVVPAIHDRLLEPDEAVRAHVAVAESPGLLITTQLLAVRLQHMPLSPAVREAGARLLDPARFKASGAAKARLAAVALNLGQPGRAQQLWREALTEGYVPEASAREPVQVPPTDGTLGGVVHVGGQPAAGVRVALYRVVPPLRLQAAPNPVRLLAATTTDAGGAFSFAGLAPRAYHLGVLLPESLGASPAGVSVTGNVGPFDLEQGARKVDAGTITFTKK